MAKRTVKRLVVANWKMYITSPEAASQFVQRLRRRNAPLKGIEIAIAPPSVFIPRLAAALKNSNIQVGAQALSTHTAGAHTGEVSASMLKHVGASFAIVGHSERRAAGERDADIEEELTRASEEQLRAILCIGERERDESGAHFELLAAQLNSALAHFPHASAARLLVIAYEPVWAIGKSAEDAMNPSQVRETSIFIRKTLVDILGRDSAMKIPILYGGSVEAQNARELINEGDIAGFLVGHASVDLDSFVEILNACRR